MTLDRHIDILFTLVFVEKFRSRWLTNITVGVNRLTSLQLGISITKTALSVTTDNAMTKFPCCLMLLTHVLSIMVFNGCTRNLVLNIVKATTREVNLSSVGKNIVVTRAVQKLKRKKLNRLRKPFEAIWKTVLVCELLEGTVVATRRALIVPTMRVLP